MLDAQGGSDIVVSHPQEISFTSGADAIACMSLFEDGMLRWYASCCNTPIGNTSRNKKMAYIGLSTVCLASAPASIDRDFGPVRMVSMTAGAKGKVASSGLKAVPVMVGFARTLLMARLSGSYRRSPFFKDGTDEPIVARKVISLEEYERLRTLA